MDSPIEETNPYLNPSDEASMLHTGDSNNALHSASLDDGFPLGIQYTDLNSDNTTLPWSFMHHPIPLERESLSEASDESLSDFESSPSEPSLDAPVCRGGLFWGLRLAQGNMVGGPAAPTAGPYTSPTSHEESPSTCFPLTDIPKELRLLVYTHILRFSRPIEPHLCDAPDSSSTIPKFHDDNQIEHNAISLRLGILYVSKDVRAEALPVFYSANTFVIGKDTASYFDRLEFLGRFSMVHNVRFRIVHRTDKYACEMLKGMVAFLRAKKMYEDRLRATEQDESLARQKAQDTNSATKHGGEEKRSLAALVGKDRPTLIAHPQYFIGGLTDLNVAVCLAKLCTTSSASATTTTTNTTSTTNPYRLALPFPSDTTFAEHPALSWFPLLTSGLGIALHIVPDEPFDNTGPRHITLTWRQRWAHKTHRLEMECPLDAAEVQRRALALPVGEYAPSTHRVDVYYRVNCRGDVCWYDVPAIERGGVLGEGLRW